MAKSAESSLPLVSREDNTRWLGERCCMQSEGDLCVVVVGGAPLLRYVKGDRVHERLAAALIAESGVAKVGSLIDAFGIDDATLWRARRRLRAEGVAGLIPAKRGPKGPSKIDQAVARQILALDRQKHSGREIARRLSISPSSVRSVLASSGERERITAEGSATVPCADAATAEAPKVDALPVEALADPKADLEIRPVAAPFRAETPEAAALYAMLGMTKDGEAEVVFESQVAAPFAGALLLVPAIAATGVLDCARSVYDRLRGGIYGLRATMLVLMLLAFLRKPRPEALKGLLPTALGDVLGILRAPEVKTVRRKLKEIASYGKAHELMRALGRRWIRDRDDELGVLYIDGHVRAYHGKKKIRQAYVTQRRLCMPATMDYWVNDASGAPIFVVTPKVSTNMTKVLPDLLAEIERMGSGKGTVVFDRGGWSQKLFKHILDGGWHILTYRKHKPRKHPKANFAEYTLEIEGRKISYMLSERRIKLGNGLHLREIAELRDDGGQTMFVTSLFEPPAALLAYRMFERWRQENFFRYMKENFALDALVDYQAEADDPKRETSNPKWKKADKKLKEARAQLAEIERAYGVAAAKNVEAKHRTMRGFKISHADIRRRMQSAQDRVTKLKSTRDAIPKTIAIGKMLAPKDVVRLSEERKLFTDAIKAAAFRAETAMLALLRPHFKRAEDEGRAFLRAAMHQPGDLIVAGDVVRVRFAPMSAPRFTAALRELCNALNAAEPRFPESSYGLRFEVAEAA